MRRQKPCPRPDPLPSNLFRQSWLWLAPFHGTAGMAAFFWGLFILSPRKAISPLLSRLSFSAVISRHFGLEEDFQCLEMANPDTKSKQRHGSSFWACIFTAPHMYQVLRSARSRNPTIHKQSEADPFSFYNLFLANTLPLDFSVFIASLNAIVISGILDAKNA